MLQEVLAQVFEHGLLNLLSHCQGLTPEEHQQIIEEYSAACSTLVAILTFNTVLDDNPMEERGFVPLG